MSGHESTPTIQDENDDEQAALDMKQIKSRIVNNLAYKTTGKPKSPEQFCRLFNIKDPNDIERVKRSLRAWARGKTSPVIPFSNGTIGLREWKHLARDGSHVETHAQDRIPKRRQLINALKDRLGGRLFSLKEAVVLRGLDPYNQSHLKTTANLMAKSPKAFKKYDKNQWLLVQESVFCFSPYFDIAHRNRLARKVYLALLGRQVMVMMDLCEAVETTPEKVRRLVSENTLPNLRIDEGKDPAGLGLCRLDLQI